MPRRSVGSWQTTRVGRERGTEPHCAADGEHELFGRPAGRHSFVMAPPATGHPFGHRVATVRISDRRRPPSHNKEPHSSFWR
jgi:hypothetical protein